MSTPQGLRHRWVVVTLLMSVRAFAAHTSLAQEAALTSPARIAGAAPRDTIYVDMSSGRGVYTGLTGRLIEISPTYLRMQTDSGARLVVPRVVRRVIFDSIGHARWLADSVLRLGAIRPGADSAQLRAETTSQLLAARTTLDRYWNREKSPVVAAFQAVKVPVLSLDFLNDLSPGTANALAGLALLLVAAYLGNRGYEGLIVGRAARELSNTKAKIDLAKARHELAVLLGGAPLPPAELETMRLLLGYPESASVAKPPTTRFTLGFSLWRSKGRAALTERLDQAWQRRAGHARASLRFGFQPVWWLLLIVQFYFALMLLIVGVELILVPVVSVFDAEFASGGIGMVVGGPALGVVLLNAGWYQWVRTRAVFRARRMPGATDPLPGALNATT